MNLKIIIKTYFYRKYIQILLLSTDALSVSTFLIQSPSLRRSRIMIFKVVLENETEYTNTNLIVFWAYTVLRLTCHTHIFFL